VESTAFWFLPIKARLRRAHVELDVTPEDEHGLKAVPVARSGAYEVRLIEFSQISSGKAFAFWIELFDHNEGIAIDGGAVIDLEEAVTFVEDLISRAQELSKKIN
jgi:hypothetical protein